MLCYFRFCKVEAGLFCSRVLHDNELNLSTVGTCVVTCLVTYSAMILIKISTGRVETLANSSHSHPSRLKKNDLFRFGRLLTRNCGDGRKDASKV